MDEGSSVEDAETTEAKGGEGAVKGEDWRKKAFADAMGKEYVSESTSSLYIYICKFQTLGNLFLLGCYN